MTDLAKMTAKERANYHYLSDVLRRLEWDLHNTIEASDRIPTEWHEIARDRHAKRKIKVTLALEEDVVRFFKSMGAGHGPRMNDVLRAFMHSRLAGVLRGAETVDYFRRRSEYFHDGRKPWWGDTARELGEGEPMTEADHKARTREYGKAQMQVRKAEF